MGWSYNSRGDERAVLFSNGNVTDLGILGTWSGGYSYSEAYSINNSGLAVGMADAGEGAITHAALFDTNNPGTVTDLGTLGGSYSWATSINDLGQIVGYSNVAGNRGNSIEHAFLYYNGVMKDLSPGSTYSFAYSVNNHGQAVGAIDGAAVIWDTDSGTATNLKILTSGATGWYLGSALGINDKGQIVGTGKLNGQSHVFLLTPLAPQPDHIVIKPIDQMVAVGASIYPLPQQSTMHKTMCCQPRLTGA